MRFQDELMMLFAGQGWQNQKFLLWQLEEFGHAFDAIEVLSFVREATAHPHVSVRRQAGWSLQLLAPTVYHRRFALRQFQGSIWTNLAVARKSTATLKRPAPEEPEFDQAAYDAALEWMRPLGVAVVERIGRADGAVSELALSVAAGLPTSEVGGFVAAHAAAHPGSFTSQLAEMRVAARSGTFGTTFGAPAPDADPDLFMIAGCLPDDTLAECWRSAGFRWPRMARIALASSLGSRSTPTGCPVVTGLLADHDPTVDAYLLRTVSRWPAAEALPVITGIARQTRSSFVRSQVLRAVAATGSPEAAAFIAQMIEGAEPTVQAQGLESLVTVGVGGSTLVKAAQSRLKHPDLRVRVNALLALATESGAIPVAPLFALVVDPSALHRLEAAYCLGFQCDERSRRLLEVFALQEPIGAVAIQAVKSLAKHPAVHSVEPLLDVIDRREDGVDVSAVRALGRFGASRSGDLESRLVSRLSRPSTVRQESRFVRALGELTARASTERVTEALSQRLESPHFEVQRAALRAWITRIGLGTAGDTPQLSTLAQSADSRISTQAALALALVGRSEGLATLSRQVASSRATEAALALEAVQELGLLVGQVLPHGGLFHLGRVVTSNPGSQRTAAAVDPVAAIKRPSQWNKVLTTAMLGSPSPLDAEVEAVASGDHGQGLLTAEPAAEGSVPGAGADGGSAVRVFQTAIQALGRIHKASRRLAWVAGRAPVRSGLRVGTYRVEDQPGGWRDRFDRALDSGLELVSRRPMAVTAGATVAALLLIGIVLSSNRPAVSVLAAVNRERLAGTVLQVQGSAVARPSGAQVAAGWPVAVGQTLNVADGASVSLMGLRGQRVAVRGPARLMCDDLSVDGRVLAMTWVGPGSLTVDAPSGSTCHVSAPGDRRVETDGGSFEIAGDAGRVTLQVLRTAVLVRGVDGARSERPTAAASAL